MHPVARLRAGGPAYWILAALVVAGSVLRVVASISWWPAVTTLADSWPYAAYAHMNQLGDPQHPAGYSLALWFIGLFSQNLAVPIVIQHVCGVAAGVVFFAAVRRLTGSPWPALVPAAVVLLSADQIFLEHTIMSEAPFISIMSVAAYLGVRAVEEPDPWWKWPAATGAVIVVAAVFRSAGLFFLPVVALAILFAKPRPWLPRWRAPVATLGVGIALLLVYASVNLSANGRFEIGPTQGWHLYGRVGQFADCGQFTPPKGTAKLCENTDPRTRPGGDFYLYDLASPATRLWGDPPWKTHDSDMRAWAQAAILGQPKTFAETVWRDLRNYYVPAMREQRPSSGGDLDPQLDWTAPEVPSYIADITNGMRTFFNAFQIEKDNDGLSFLHDYQRVFRVGAALLSIFTLLTLLGLLVGPRRSRVGVLLFGVGGLSLLAAPTLTVYYTGRYSVPVAPLISAGAAITVWTLWRMEAQRRRARQDAQGT